MNNTAKNTTEPCDKYSIELLFDYSDGELSNEETLAFESHIPNCTACLQLLDSFQAFNYVSESTEKEYYHSKESIEKKLWYTTLHHQWKYYPANLMRDFFQSLLGNWKKTSMKFGLTMMTLILMIGFFNKLDKSIGIELEKDWTEIYEQGREDAIAEFNVVSEELRNANNRGE